MRELWARCTTAVVFRYNSVMLFSTLIQEEAVRLIQINERARQGRLRAKFMKEIRSQEERERVAATRGAPTMDRTTAVILIQKMWKGS